MEKYPAFNRCDIGSNPIQAILLKKMYKIVFKFRIIFLLYLLKSVFL